MRPIFIIGFMGSGKSTFGRALARAAGLQFIDLDNYIELRFHANVRDLFAKRGEEGFRDIEHRMLQEVSDFEDVIVACGGGTPCFFNNIDLMNSRGTTVMLHASIDTLLRRLKLGRHRRPLIAAMSDDELESFIGSALEQRMPHYSQAAETFSGDRLDSAAEIAETIADFAKTHNITLINP